MNIWVNSVILGQTQHVVIIPQQYKERAPHTSVCLHTHTLHTNENISSYLNRPKTLSHYITRTWRYLGAVSGCALSTYSHKSGGVSLQRSYTSSIKSLILSDHWTAAHVHRPSVRPSSGCSKITFMWPNIKTSLLMSRLHFCTAPTVQTVLIIFIIYLSWVVHKEKQSMNIFGLWTVTYTFNNVLLMTTLN